jgi:hypothetical protein
MAKTDRAERDAGQTSPTGEHREMGESSEQETEIDWGTEKARRLDELLQKVETKIGGNEFKASVGDFVRLLQLRKEIEDVRPKEITVRWVEPSEEENAPAI